MPPQPQSDEELVKELHQHAKELAYSRVAPRVIIERLVERGLDEKRAATIAYNLNYEVARSKHKADGTTAMMIGAFIASIGILVTYVSYSNSSEGSAVTIFYGLIIAGLIIFYRGWSKAHE